jgi:hypothetical protein
MNCNCTPIPTMGGFKLTPRARTAMIGAGVGTASWAFAKAFYPQYQTPIVLGGSALGTILGEVYESYLQNTDNPTMEGMDGRFKDWVRRTTRQLYAASGEISSFKLFDSSQNIGELWKDSFTGTGLALAAAFGYTGGMDVLNDIIPPDHTNPNAPNYNPISTGEPPIQAGVSPVLVGVLGLLIAGTAYQQGYFGKDPLGIGVGPSKKSNTKSK